MYMLMDVTTNFNIKDEKCSNVDILRLNVLMLRIERSIDVEGMSD